MFDGQEMKAKVFNLIFSEKAFFYAKALGRL
jgi:hypothetical protein